MVGIRFWTSALVSEQGSIGQLEFFLFNLGGVMRRWGIALHLGASWMGGWVVGGREIGSNCHPLASASRVEQSV